MDEISVVRGGVVCVFTANGAPLPVRDMIADSKTMTMVMLMLTSHKL